MTRLSPDEYADLLVARRDAYYVDHPPRPGFPAMLDWFIEDGDEDLVDVAAVEAATRPLEDDRPRRARTYRPASYRPASYWRDRLAKVDARLDAINGIRRHDTSDLAAYGGIGIRQTARQTRRHGSRIDAVAAEYVRLTTQRSNLVAKLARAETREKATT